MICWLSQVFVGWMIWFTPSHQNLWCHQTWLENHPASSSMISPYSTKRPFLVVRSHDFPMIFPWFSYGFSHDFPCKMTKISPLPRHPRHPRHPTTAPWTCSSKAIQKMLTPGNSDFAGVFRPVQPTKMCLGKLVYQRTCWLNQRKLWFIVDLW